jgi:hypothetical protein
MAAVGVLPDNIKRIAVVIFVTLPTLDINRNRPAEPVAKLSGAVLEHCARQDGKANKFMGMKKSDHGNTSEQKNCPPA